MELSNALGLTDGESKVYKALISLKSASTGPIYKRAGVSQSKVYEILERLRSKGLAASIVKDGVTFWHPANPSIVLEQVDRDLESLETRKKFIEKELPRLLKEETYPADEAQVFLGYDGFRSCLFSLLDTFESGDCLCVFGSPVEIPDPFYTFLKAYNLERAKRKVDAKFLYGESLRSFAKGLYSIQRTELRFMSGLTPSTIAIGKDRIIIMSWDGPGRFVVIMGKEISSGYLAFFDSLWSMSKK